MDAWMAEQRSGSCTSAGERNWVSARTSSQPSPLRWLRVTPHRSRTKTSSVLAFVDLSPQQTVPKLADMGIYVASESTIYRILRDEKGATVLATLQKLGVVPRSRGRV